MLANICTLQSYGTWMLESIFVIVLLNFGTVCQIVEDFASIRKLELVKAKTHYTSFHVASRQQVGNKFAIRGSYGETCPMDFGPN